MCKKSKRKNEIEKSKIKECRGYVEIRILKGKIKKKKYYFN